MVLIRHKRAWIFRARLTQCWSTSLRARFQLGCSLHPRIRVLHIYTRSFRAIIPRSATACPTPRASYLTRKSTLFGHGSSRERKTIRFKFCGQNRQEQRSQSRGCGCAWVVGHGWFHRGLPILLGFVAARGAPRRRDRSMRIPRAPSTATALDRVRAPPKRQPHAPEFDASPTLATPASAPACIVATARVPPMLLAPPGARVTLA